MDKGVKVLALYLHGVWALLESHDDRLQGMSEYKRVLVVLVYCIRATGCIWHIISIPAP